MKFFRNGLMILLLCILFIFISIDILAAQTELNSYSRIIHTPIQTANAGRDILLKARIEPKEYIISDIRIYYRNMGDSDYNYVEMIEETASHRAVIPGKSVNPPITEYFILVLFENGETLTLPERDPYNDPYQITILDETYSTKSEKKLGERIESDYFKILYPAPNQFVAWDEPLVIAIGFNKERENFDISAISLKLDDRNMTSELIVSDFIISLTTQNLSSGKHTILVKGYDDTKQIIDSIQWSFYINKRKMYGDKKAHSFSGRVYSDIREEKVKSRILDTINSGFNFSGNYGNTRYRASAFITSREKLHLQPRNRYLIEVGTKKFGIKLGDVNPRFNNLILWGKRVRGINLVLKLGYFNLDIVHGTTNRSNEGILYPYTIDALTAERIYLHPENGDTVNTVNGIYRTGVYQQNLIGLRPSFGSRDRFQLAFNFLKVKDDAKSIQNGISPRDNLVFGPELYLAFDNKKIEFISQASYSILTNDISTGSLSRAEVDSIFDVNLPFDPENFENLIILNESTSPLEPRELTSLSYQSRLSLKYMGNNFRIIYKKIGSDYYSLGNSFLRTNIRGFSVFDRIQLLKNRLYLNIGYDFFDDDLNNQNDENPDTEMTQLNTLYVGFSYIPVNTKLPRLNITYKDHDRDNGTESEYAINNNTRDISAQISYSFTAWNMRNTFDVGVTGSDRVDDINPMSSNLVSDFTMASLRTEFLFPLRTSLTYSSNQTETGRDEYLMSFKYRQFTAGATYLLIDNKLKLNVSLNRIYSNGASNALGTESLEKYVDYERTGLNFGASLRLAHRHNFLLDSMYIIFNDKLNSTHYNDYIVRFRYEIRI